MLAYQWPHSTNISSMNSNNVHSSCDKLRRQKWMFIKMPTALKLLLQACVLHTTHLHTQTPLFSHFLLERGLKVLSLHFQQMIADQESRIYKACERHLTPGRNRKRNLPRSSSVCSTSEQLSSLKTRVNPNNTSPDRWSSLSLPSSGEGAPNVPVLIFSVSFYRSITTTTR